MFVALFIISIVVAIMIHEFGHYVTAKMFGMKAERFFLGFGPTLWSTRRGETEYGVKAIPAGGFVKIAGMTPWEEVDPADDGRLFYQQAAWKRVIVLVAGSVTHFLVALVLLFSAFAFVGLPVATNEIVAVVEDSPAVAAGLQVGDRIIAVNGQVTTTFEDVRDAVQPRGGARVTVTVARDGAVEDVTVVLDRPHPEGGVGVGFLGISPARQDEPLGVTGGLRETFSGDLSLVRLTSLTVEGLGQVFSLDALGNFFASVGEEGPRDPETITSLVGVGQAVNALGTQGDVFAVLAILAQLNIVLGLLNMLPLPPLDGGHVAVLAVEETVHSVRRLRGRARTEPKWRLNPAVIIPVALVVIGFFLVLTTTAIYVDITNPASQLVQ